MMKIDTMFITPYGEHPSEPSEAGRKMQDEYGYEINKKGQKVLVKTGETNLWQKIQDELESTKIENILAQAAVGDMTHFRPDGIYADVADMPKTLVEAQQQIHALETMWEGIPNDIKEKYNHDVGEFVAKAGSDEWLTDMGIIGAEIEEVKAPEAPEMASLGQIKEGETNES